MNNHLNNMRRKTGKNFEIEETLVLSNKRGHSLSQGRDIRERTLGFLSEVLPMGVEFTTESDSEEGIMDSEISPVWTSIKR